MHRGHVIFRLGEGPPRLPAGAGHGGKLVKLSEQVVGHGISLRRFAFDGVCVKLLSLESL
jgi:hypothetical protein